MAKNKVEARYFITCEWCRDGRIGILCDREGLSFHKKTQHTKEEMRRKLGHLWRVLYPKSEKITKEECLKYNSWIPLAVYCDKIGIATRKN